MSACVVRVALASDAPQLAEMIGGFRNHLGATRPTAEELEKLLPELMGDFAIEFCLAFPREDPRPGDGPQGAIGYSQCRFFRSLWARGSQAHLEDLFVAAPARGRGVGGALLSFALERARERDCVAVGLHTNERNDRAHAFYRRAGFEPESEARWPGGQEVFWTRALAPR